MPPVESQASPKISTLSPAEYFGVRHDVGSIAPGRLADILFVEDLRELRPHRVLADEQFEIYAAEPAVVLDFVEFTEPEPEPPA